MRYVLIMYLMINGEPQVIERSHKTMLSCLDQAYTLYAQYGPKVITWWSCDRVQQERTRG